MTSTSPPDEEGLRVSSRPRSWLLRPGLTMAVILVALVLAGCREDRTTPSPSDGPEATSSEAPEVSVDRIIYVSPEGDLITIKPDGSSQQRLTGGTQLRAGPDGPASNQAGEVLSVQSVDFDNFYAWPTWSPDAARLAASRLQITDDQELQVSVQIINATKGSSVTVWTDRPSADTTRNRWKMDTLASGRSATASASPLGDHMNEEKASRSNTDSGLPGLSVSEINKEPPGSLNTG